MNGIDGLFRKLDALGTGLTDALNRAMDTTLILAEDTARNNAPANKYSQADSSGGASLKGSIKHEKKNAGDAIEGRVYTNAPHNMHVEFGTGPVGAADHAGISPHISPSYTTRKSWAYPTVIDGKETFVTTSGQPARPYLYPAAVEHKDTLTKQAEIEMRNAIRRVTGG